MKHGRSVVAAAVLTVVVAGTALAWGADGHRMIGRAAVDGLPADVPAFFTAAAEQLAYLNPEPDRWRDDDLAAMNEAWAYDHYIDLENVPDGALEAPDRFRFMDALYAAGVEDPARTVGFLPYRIMELYQRLATGFARWRTAGTDRERGWIEARIINDAGILGHYVADASNPHHTTIHYNGWAASAPNPRGYTTARDFHWRFESLFVRAAIEYDDVAAAVPAGVAPVADLRTAVLGYIMEAHGQVGTLYDLERDFGFLPGAPTPETEAFAVRRLAAAATMLRTLWYSAWVESAALAAREEGS
jgi:hypothetical protein